MNAKENQKNQHQRLLQVMATLSRAEDGLRRSRIRLFEQHAIDAAWVTPNNEFPEREDMMESFASKFNRFQDILGDKLLPLLLRWKGERSGALIDNLNRAERLGWIPSTEQWMEARVLRNKLVHEYVMDPETFAQSLLMANALSLMLLQTWKQLQTYIEHADAAE